MTTRGHIFYPIFMKTDQNDSPAHLLNEYKTESHRVKNCSQLLRSTENLVDTNLLSYFTLIFMSYAHNICSINFWNKLEVGSKTRSPAQIRGGISEHS